ncbi:lipid II:glycine glycyltransferase FemX [Aquimarina aquimarini]|uniref:lipid II:glycine glycyltransferase FemX n=1 Tax=Aquimarina aquimarini TaxID=1191734 RepID=UPI000D557CA9|nr:peptidoglycan bridge formation glycyltransferase FemA/FemB family protein [Aquimarina aquimarini]
MTKEYKTHNMLGAITEQQWQVLLASSDTANFFQTKQALHFFKNVGLETFGFAIERGSKITALIAGIIQKEKGIKSTFTSRAIIYGGPVFSNDVTNTEIEELLKQVVKKMHKKAIYFEIRNLNDYSSYKDVFQKVGFEYVPHCNFHLDCSDEGVMRKRMSSSKLRQVKKSIKNGAEIIEAQNTDDIAAYYTILHHLYTTKVKTPLPDLEFFQKMWESKTARFLLIQYQGEIIGGIVCPILKDKVIYEWFVCGKDGVYKNVYPSILATWAAMEYAYKNDIARFDFMGAGKPDQDYGVREFKSKFGGDLVEHGRFLYVSKPILYNIGKTAVKILKKTS